MFQPLHPGFIVMRHCFTLHFEILKWLFDKTQKPQKNTTCSFSFLFQTLTFYFTLFILYQTFDFLSLTFQFFSDSFDLFFKTFDHLFHLTLLTFYCKLLNILFHTLHFLFHTFLSHIRFLKSQNYDILLNFFFSQKFDFSKIKYVKVKSFPKKVKSLTYKVKNVN